MRVRDHRGVRNFFEVQAKKKKTREEKIYIIFREIEIHLISETFWSGLFFLIFWPIVSYLSIRAEGNRFLYMHELCIAQKYVTLQNLVTDNTLSYKYVGRKNFLPTYTLTDILKAVSPFECN